MSTENATAVIQSQQLRLKRAELSLAPSETRRVDIPSQMAKDVTVEPGDLVAVHWGRVCDRLMPEQVARLRDSTERQLHITNRRLVQSSS